MASATGKSPTTAKRGNVEGDGLKIIHAGLYRTGTASMAEAYRTLGYRVHHGLDDPLGNPWIDLEKAAEATWPALAKLPEYTYAPHNDSGPVPRPPFQREDWERMLGRYDVATDVVSPFALELIKAYPEAKVVVVERPFESWWPSFQTSILDTLYHRFSWLQDFVAWDILGIRATQASRKIHAGFFGAPDFTKEWITETRARRRYEEYYRKVRDAVPLESGRRLEYTLGSGWGPLCEFLGKGVPDCDFPRVNDRKALARENRVINAELGIMVCRKMVLWIAPLVVLLFSMVSLSRWTGGLNNWATT